MPSVPTCRPSRRVRRTEHRPEGYVSDVMPRFLTLRDSEGKALVTAMLPPAGLDERIFKPIIVGFENDDPYAEYGDAIAKLGQHVGLTLDRARCYPYHRGYPNLDCKAPRSGTA